MESFEVLEQAIPRAASPRVAQMLGISADLVRKWRREPESDESPLATGQRSILDRICDLIDYVFLVNPKGSALIVNYINCHHQQLVATHAKPIDDHESRAETVSDLLTEAAEAINHLNLHGCTNGTLRQLIEMRDAADRAIKRVEKTIGGNQ
jgi:hypothetical protein